MVDRGFVWAFLIVQCLSNNSKQMYVSAVVFQSRMNNATDNLLAHKYLTQQPKNTHWNIELVMDKGVDTITSSICFFV